MFHNLYKKQTMFTKQTIDNRLDGELPGFDDTVTFQIPRKGDLINTIFIRMVLRKSPTTFIVPIQAFGYEVFEYMELLIGDKIVDHMTGLEMRLLMKTSSTKNNVNALAVMCGDFVHDEEEQRIEFGRVRLTDRDQYDTEYRYYYVPIPFYFFRNPSLAVPLCALTKQEVSIRFKLKPYRLCISQVIDPAYGVYPVDAVGITTGNYTDPLFSITELSVPVEYLYVSDEECRYFKETPLNYTITQTQRTVMNATEVVKKELKFINPIKEIIMYPTLTRCLDISETDPIYKNRYILFNKFRNTTIDTFLYEFSSTEAYKGVIKSAELTFDDKTYVSHSVANYRFLKTYQNMIARGRYTYNNQPDTTYEDILGLSFAFEPTNFMDTGYINFNAFKSIKLEIRLLNGVNVYDIAEDHTVFVFARSINILIIKDGVCDLVFKNSII